MWLARRVDKKKVLQLAIGIQALVLLLIYALIGDGAPGPLTLGIGPYGVLSQKTTRCVGSVSTDGACHH